MCARANHSVDVAGENVNFDIKLSAGLDLAERRVMGRVRDDVDGEMGPVSRLADVIDGERHAVEPD